MDRADLRPHSEPPPNKRVKRSLGIPLVGLAIAVSIIGGLVGWTEYTSWRQLVQLRQDHSAVQIDSFHFAEHLKASILSLNQTVLRFAGRENVSDREQFLAESRALGRWIEENKGNPTTALEQRLMEQIEAAFANYVREADQLMTRSTDRPPSYVWNVFEEVNEDSTGILALCDELAAAHREALNAFVTESHESIIWLHRLLLISLVLLLLLGAGLMLLVDRGILAPMRTELEHSHAIIERQEKLSALGVLAAGVAHEIRSPLTAVKVRLHSLNRAVKTDPSAREDVTVISDEIIRLERILKDFLQFARPSEPQFSVIPADILLREVHDLLKSALDNTAIQLTLDLQTSQRVRVDPQQVKQVFLNLVQNAADSISGPGRITLRSRTGSGERGSRRRQGVILEVSDTGRGIPVEVRRRLFDPFFTTKETGTGLGLSIAARIVEKHDGALEFQTELDRGTTFSIVLPEAITDEAQSSDHRG
jgi:signal transduction histidine kinase